MQMIFKMLAAISLSSALAFGQRAESKDNLGQAVLPITQDFGSKLRELEAQIPLDEVFKAYGVAFPDSSDIKLTGNSTNGFHITSKNTQDGNDLVRAISDWFGKYSKWFSTRMILPDTEAVTDARCLAISEIYEGYSATKK